ncbi:MAG TPA: hypothetical protein VES02_07900 [Dermatophilaceae bacterium]|nr:hypothetical protein [Dermatophilaceae bacterium]
MDPESVDVTAGLGGFLAFFLLAVALYFLMRNMNVRLRRMSYREEQEARETGARETGAKETGTADGPDLG